MLSKVILPLAASSLLVAGNDVDCEYSVCNKVLTSSDCAAIGTTCVSYGGIPSCSIGENEFECNDIRVANPSSCASDVHAYGLCSGFSFDHVTTCAVTEGDCDTGITSVTPAPTPVGGNAIYRIDCSYDSCTQVLTATDCISLESQCRAHGGTSFSCDPGDNEFECNNIAYSGTSVCTDALALAQCNTYSYPGYTCVEKEGDCDDPVLTTLPPTPATRSTPMYDCDFEDCTTILTADDCARLNSECSAHGGVGFCIPGHNEFECNNLPWTSSATCIDDVADTQCLALSFTGVTCAERDGDCSSVMGNEDSSEDSSLSDGEKVAVALTVPLAVAGLGLTAWYVVSKRNNNPPMSESGGDRPTEANNL